LQRLQVVQNALWIAQLAGYSFGFKAPAPGSNPTTTNIGDPTLTRERQGLWLLVAVEAGITLVLPGLAVPLLVVPACHSCKRGEVSCLQEDTQANRWCWMSSRRE
jgi:hypothetical protein